MKNKIFVILMIILVFIAANSNLLTVKKADAIIVTTDIPRDTADRIGIAVWKAAAYPFIRNMVLNFVATGDFKIGWNTIKDFLIKDLAFQTANAILLEYFGLELCATIGGNVRIALLQMNDGIFQPNCTFNQSKVAQLSEKLIQGNTAEAWQEVRNYYFANFHLSLNGSSNEFGQWWELRDNIYSQTKQRQQNIRFEMLINEGFLGQYDCSGVPKNKRPGNCRVLSPGMITAEWIKSSVRDPMASALKAQMINDLSSLAGIVVDMIKNKFIYSIYEKL